MMTLLARVPSTLGGYDVGVIEYMSGGRTILAMQELCDTERPNHVFSFSFADPLYMHSTPVGLTAMMTDCCRALCRTGKNVLIAGLGAGLTHTQLQCAGYNVTSVEPDPVVTDLARRFWAFDGQVIGGKIEDVVVGLADEAFDVILLNHYSKAHSILAGESEHPLLDQLFAKIAPGGSIIVNVFKYDNKPNTKNIERWASERTDVTCKVYHHVDAAMNRLVTLTKPETINTARTNLEKEECTST